MGATASRFESTNWKVATGGCTDDTMTLDGAKPTSEEKSIMFVTKKGLMNDREMTVTTEDGQPLYETVVQPGTFRWFNVQEASTGKKILSVQTGPFRHEWEIYTLVPNYDGQQPDPKASKADKEEESLYKKAVVNYKAFQTRAAVFKYEKGDDPIGVVSKDHILAIEEIRAIRSKYQTVLKLGDENLVSYWEWEVTKNEQKMTYTMAANTDIVLQAIIGVIANCVEMDRGGGA